MRAAQDIDVLTGEADLSTEAEGRPRSLLLAGTTAVVVIIVDQLTKLWATDRLTAGPCSPGGDECIDLIGSLRLHLVHNPGAAFSTGTSLGPLFGIIATVMAVFLFHLSRSRTDRLGPIVLGAIAGGAVGNLLDRLFRASDGILNGAVIDFIDAQWWPVFNVADSAVVVGVLIFAVLLFREGDESDTADAGSGEAMTGHQVGLEEAAGD